MNRKKNEDAILKVIDKYQVKSGQCEQTDKITVAVAVYNSDLYLERAIQSLINQTYHNLEIILVDDGSTDNCPQICDDYAKKDTRIKVIHQKNQGLFSGRNVGIEHATGDYITFLDGDDFIDPMAYESMLFALKENDADLIACRYKWVYSDETIDHSTEFLAIMNDTEMLEKYIEEDDKYQIQNAAWNKMYKCSLIENLRFPSRWYEDMLYTIQLLTLPKKSLYWDKAFYNYICDRSTSIMNKGINKRVFSDLIPNLYDRSAFLRDLGREDLAQVHDYYLYKRLLLFYQKVVRSKDANKKEYKRELIKLIHEGKSKYEAAYSCPVANSNEYKKMKIFLTSPMLYRITMWLNDKIILPLKQR